MNYLVYILLLIVYFLLGIYLEEHLIITKPALWAAYGFVFGYVGSEIINWSK